MSEGSTNETYVFEKELLESLRLEAQDVSPEKKKEFDELVRDSYARFIKKFEKFIDRSVEKTPMEDRFILTDAETNEEFQNIYGVDPNKRVHQYSSSVGVFRAYNSDGNFVIGVPQEAWHKMSAKNQTDIIKLTGSEDEAQKFVRKAINQNCILHEMTHLYQPGGEKSKSIPLWLLECQAYWVGRELCDEDSQIHTEEFDKIADFYQKLLNTYGEEVHEVCFSKNRAHNVFIMDQILNEFTLEVQQEIFPEFQIIQPVNQ